MAPGPFSEVHQQARRRAHEHAVRTEELLASLGPVLDGAVNELQERGTTVVEVPPAVIRARIVRLRRGDSVLEIAGSNRPGVEVTTGNRARLGRQEEEEQQAEVLKRYLAHALADLVPRP